MLICKHHVCNYNCCMLMLYIIGLIVSPLPFGHGYLTSSKVLNVGEELWKQILPLQMGSCFYQIQVLKPWTWYEVKISYLASIRASFSIQLQRSSSHFGMTKQKKLLNTEKLIFKSDDMEFLAEQGKTFVLVTVEPEGEVALSHEQEREHIVFNIGIPYKAWWVVILVVVCLGLALVIPYLLPSYLLQTNVFPQLPQEITSKNF